MLYNVHALLSCDKYNVSASYWFIISVLLITSVINIYLIRGNITIGPAIKHGILNLIQDITKLLLNRRLGLVYEIILLLLVCIKYMLFTNLAFTATLYYFYLYYLVIFYILLPTVYILNTILYMLSYVKGIYDNINFNKYNLNVIFIFSLFLFYM